MSQNRHGFNPFRWDCLDKGCFNLKQRPKIELFCEAFPGQINFSDIDGVVEIRGNSLLLEWKSAPLEIPTGQRIAFEQWSRSGLFTIFVLAGNAQTMIITHRNCFFASGVNSGWKPCNFKMALELMKRWADWAVKHPQPAPQILRVMDNSNT